MNNYIGNLNKQPNSRVGQWLKTTWPFKLFCNKGTISVIRINGPLHDHDQVNNIAKLNSSIEKAFRPSNLLAVCLIINSTGGSLVQAELIAKRLQVVAATKRVPVYSFIEDTAVAGGYWLACVGEAVYAAKNSILGGTLEDTGALKYREIQPANLGAIKQQMHQNFVNHVKQSRAGKVTSEDILIFNNLWIADKALELGLIDGIEDLYTFIYKKFGEEININYLSPTNTLWANNLWVRQQLLGQNSTPGTLSS